MIINFDLLPNLFLSAPQSGGLKTYRSWTGAAGRVVFVDCCCSLVFENARSKSKGQHFRLKSVQEVLFWRYSMQLKWLKLMARHLLRLNDATMMDAGRFLR
jgi:hypothetical protein